MIEPSIGTMLDEFKETNKEDMIVSKMIPKVWVTSRHVFTALKDIPSLEKLSSLFDHLSLNASGLTEVDVALTTNSPTIKNFWVGVIVKMPLALQQKIMQILNFA